MDKWDRSSATKCPHCKGETETGLHGGCGTCRLVKTTTDGRRVPRTKEY